ncbi:insulin-2-like [Tachypleus tridentatus]|uniref:insulin-2-like n=1 Tax=Tachypleus tridentatus TaxID=6853 RepID=UPI003FD69E64
MATKLTSLISPVCIVIGLLLLTSRADSSVRLCGSHLSEALALLCRAHGGFYSPHAKRSVPVTLLERIRRNAAVVNQRNTVVNRQSGVADECCRRACSLQTLTSYCAFPQATEGSSPIHRIASVGRQSDGIHVVENSSQQLMSQNSVSQDRPVQDRGPENSPETSHRGSSGLVVNPRTEEYILV